MKEYYLLHYGIPRKSGRYPWGSGERPYQGDEEAPKINKKIDRQAKKDAKEYARAKVSYGIGAGNKRKLINHTVKQRSRDSKEYKEAFEKYLEQEDMGKHTAAAKREHAINETKHKTGVVARGIYHSIIKDGAKVAVGVAAAYAIAHKTGLDKKIANFATTKMNDIAKEIKWQQYKRNNGNEWGQWNR